MLLKMKIPTVRIEDTLGPPPGPPEKWDIPSLIARYTFDEENYRDSKGSYHGTGDGTFIDGILGKGATFATTGQKATLPIPDDFMSGNAEFSICMWNRLDGDTYPGSYHLAWDLPDGKKWQIVNNSGRWGLARNASYANSYDFLVGNSLAGTGWHFLAFGYDGEKSWGRLDDGLYNPNYATTAEKVDATSITPNAGEGFYMEKTGDTVVSNDQMHFFAGHTLTTAEMDIFYNAGVGI